MDDFMLDLMDSEPQAQRTKKQNQGLSMDDVKRHVRALVIVARHQERRRKKEEREQWQ